MRFRPPAKRDSNHASVVAALRGAGVEVFDTASQGDGFPDLLCYHRRTGLSLVEIKDGSLPASHRKLTPMEAKFAARFPVLVVLSAQDAVSQVLGRFFERGEPARNTTTDDALHRARERRRRKTK